MFRRTGAEAEASRLRLALAGLIALALIVSVGYIVWRIVVPPGQRDDSRTSSTPAVDGCEGVVASGTGECLGPVTDESRLDGSIRDVAGKILAMNREVAGQPRYVRVALLTPLSVAPPPAESAMSLDQVRFSLQGAYVALRRVNASAAFGDKNAPAVQLLLVNQGSGQPFDTSLVERIEKLGDAEHPLVAVVGLGSSKPGTEQMAEALSIRGIPMVGAVTSATTLTAARFSTFHSVSPSNSDYANAMKDLLDKNARTLPRNGIVVRDANNDPYSQTLADTYNDVLKDYIKFSPQNFHGGTERNAGAPRAFDGIVRSLCTAVNHKTKNLQMVFFAGRVADFPSFAEMLKERTCDDEPLTVMVGATGFQLSKQQEAMLDEANVSVIWVSSADAPAWIEKRNGTPAGFADFLKVYRDEAKYPADTLNDGYALMYHDAVASAVRAIRMAAERVDIPTAEGVQTQFGNVALAYEVSGATGTLSFGERADIDGRATGKAVMYRQIGSKGPRLPADVQPYLTR
ncbi:hypothetical protein [Micromonospora sp. WMMD964]|uniref:hypothetical protein n=1 Tax=Micromonospora sp. WMMD964 TaxID=3016091 RepID=UPI00249B0F2A|nr:hypothetical protein [Micromonospora sp. WMMD964]WFF00519.1 hypothetical protein O7616_27160 [Micromonospora sp. WMMD964]